MPNVSSRFITVAILYALLAMCVGIWMGIHEDFEHVHLHAHINLVAGVWFTLFGLVYRAYPALASTRLAALHFWLANLGAVAFLPGIYIRRTYDQPLPVIVGSLLVLAAMVVFFVNFRRNYDAGGPASSMA